MHIRRFRSVLRSTPIAICICLALTGRALAQAADEPLSPEVLAQIAAIQQEKASRTPAEQKISSRLLYAIKLQRGEPLPAGISLRLPSLAPDASGRIEVDIASRAGTDLRAMLTSSNAAVMNVKTEPRGGVDARARIDANGIMALAARVDVTSVRLPAQARVQSVDRVAAALEGTWGQGTYVTEGLLTHRFNAPARHLGSTARA
jgi:hypothetical protein